MSSRKHRHCVMLTNLDHKKGILADHMLRSSFVAFLGVIYIFQCQAAGAAYNWPHKSFSLSKCCRQVQRSLVCSVSH